MTSNDLFLLKLKEHRRVTQITIDDIVEGNSALLSSTVQHIEAGVKAECGLDPDIVTDIFKDLPNPFNGIETRYLQEKFYHEHFGLIVSIKIENFQLCIMYFLFLVGSCRNSYWSTTAYL